MQISRGITALATAGLLAVTVTGAAARAATSPAGGCTPTWKLVSAPAAPGPDPRALITGVAVDPAGDAWFPATNTIFGGLSWTYHWHGHSFAASNALPQGSYTQRGTFIGEPFDGPFIGPASFDSPTDGWQIGTATHPDSATNSAFDNPGYAAHWSGGRWSIVPLPVSPDPASFTVNTYGVAAVSAADAWAVGNQDWGASGGALIEHWDGSQWSIVPNPGSGLPYTTLWSVNAVSASDIWAVGGQNANGAGGQTPFAEHWDGSSWSVVRAPAGSTPSLFTTVSADGSSDAWAVGGQTAGGLATGLLEHWDGHAWSVVSGLPDLGNSELLGVYAASPADVWATVYAPRTDTDLGVDEFLHWDGSSWSTVPVPGPHEYNLDYEYTGIAGAGPDDVWAAGYVEQPEGFSPVIAHLSCG